MCVGLIVVSWNFHPSLSAFHYFPAMMSLNHAAFVLSFPNTTQQRDIPTCKNYFFNYTSFGHFWSNARACYILQIYIFNLHSKILKFYLNMLQVSFSSSFCCYKLSFPLNNGHFCITSDSFCCLTDTEILPDCVCWYSICSL